MVPGTNLAERRKTVLMCRLKGYGLFLFGLFIDRETRGCAAGGRGEVKRLSSQKQRGARKRMNNIVIFLNIWHCVLWTGLAMDVDLLHIHQKLIQKTPDMTTNEMCGQKEKDSEPLTNAGNETYYKVFLPIYLKIQNAMEFSPFVCCDVWVQRTPFSKECD